MAVMENPIRIDNSPFSEIISPKRPKRIDERVVSLLTILQHKAQGFWRLARLLQLRAGADLLHDNKEILLALKEHCEALGLKVAAGLLGQPENYKGSEAKAKAFFDNVANVIQLELASKKFLYVSVGDRYLDGRWLSFLNPITFPSAVRELEAAGRCYAYGEPDASLFHSMRALDFVLRSLAAEVGVDYAQNWQNILNAIEARLKAASHSGKKSAADKEREHFYAQLGGEFKFFKDGWRNYAMHAVEHYSDRDAEQMLTHVDYFVELASKHLSE